MILQVFDIGPTITSTYAMISNLCYALFIAHLLIIACVWGPPANRLPAATHRCVGMLVCRYNEIIIKYDVSARVYVLSHTSQQRGSFSDASAAPCIETGGCNVATANL